MVILREREMTNEQNSQPFVACVVVFDKKKEKVLLVRHSAQRKEGMVALPGGRPIMGSNETLTEAAIRELHEETGLKTNPESLISYPNNNYLGVMKRENKDKYYALKAFICVDYQGELKRISREGKVFWAKITKLDRYGNKLPPTAKKVVTDSLAFLNK